MKSSDIKCGRTFLPACQFVLFCPKLAVMKALPSGYLGLVNFKAPLIIFWLKRNAIRYFQAAPYLHSFMAHLLRLRISLEVSLSLSQSLTLCFALSHMSATYLSQATSNRQLSPSSATFQPYINQCEVKSGHMPHASHVPATCQPLGNHIPAMCRLQEVRSERSEG